MTRACVLSGLRPYLPVSASPYPDSQRHVGVGQAGSLLHEGQPLTLSSTTAYRASFLLILPILPSFHASTFDAQLCRPTIAVQYVVLLVTPLQ